MHDMHLSISRGISCQTVLRSRKRMTALSIFDACGLEPSVKPYGERLTVGLDEAFQGLALVFGVRLSRWLDVMFIRAFEAKARPHISALRRHENRVSM